MSEPDVFWTEEDLYLPGGGMLNPDLVRQQNLSKPQIQEIVDLHRLKDQVMRDAHNRIKAIEFQMQKAWGFPQNEDKHTHRFRVPCPEE